MEAFIRTLLECSVAMAVISLIYMYAAPRLSKRYSAKWLYYAWLMIGAGWIFPFRFRIELPFFQVQDVNIPATPVQFLPPAGDTLPSPITTAGDVVNAPAAMTLWWLLAAIWILGVISVVVYHILRHRRFIKMVNRWSEPVTDLKSLGILNALKSQLGIKKQPGLSVCQSITSPMLVGFFRPTILLPLHKNEGNELSLILKHELIHFQRHDLWHKALILAATVLHWFNPVVYIMAKATALQCEISCDALVLQGADFQKRKQYGETIIGVVRNGAKFRTALSTNFYGGKKGMENRISSIMDTKRKKTGVIILCAVLASIIITGGVALSAPTSDKQDKQDVLSLVENFGDMLKMVTLTAPQDIVAKSIEEHYSGYVTPELLAMWQSDPLSAPGRTLSSPWPDRIEITDITFGDGEYTVSGAIIEVTSTELQNGGAAAKYPVTLLIIKQDDRWLISNVTLGSPVVAGPPDADANTEGISYTQEEIDAAMKAAETYFQEIATSRTMERIWFDKEACTKMRSSYMQYGNGSINGVKEENVIVLLCDFEIKDYSSFEGKYPSWNLIFIRENGESSWVLDDQGY
ncbi:MAG: M56 family metallopeptidase [Desulfotomaculaceae bacterium]|nr:M56 family metallopeptidase [Desulfotomaculaceae bacterium]